MSFSPELLAGAAALLQAFKARGLMLVTAESCTGGLLGGLLTAVSGSSAVYERGFVTYSNQAKQDCLGVPGALLREYGAVSVEVAAAMAEGALRGSSAHVAISITGIAGPDGGSPEKPVGLVCFGLAQRGQPAQTFRQVFSGDREAIRAQALAFSVQRLLAL